MRDSLLQYPYTDKKLRHRKVIIGRINDEAEVQCVCVCVCVCVCARARACTHTFRGFNADSLIPGNEILIIQPTNIH